MPNLKSEPETFFENNLQAEFIQAYMSHSNDCDVEQFIMIIEGLSA